MIGISKQFWLDVCPVAARVGDSDRAAGLALRFLQYMHELQEQGLTLTADEFRLRFGGEVLIPEFARIEGNLVVAVGTALKPVTEASGPSRYPEKARAAREREARKREAQSTDVQTVVHKTTVVVTEGTVPSPPAPPVPSPHTPLPLTPSTSTPSTPSLRSGVGSEAVNGGELMVVEGQAELLPVEREPDMRAPWTPESEADLVHMIPRKTARRFSQLYCREYLEREFIKAFGYYENNPRKRPKNRRGWLTAISSWLERGWPRYVREIPGQTGPVGGTSDDYFDELERQMKAQREEKQHGEH